MMINVLSNGALHNLTNNSLHNVSIRASVARLPLDESIIDIGTQENSLRSNVIMYFCLLFVIYVFMQIVHIFSADFNKGTLMLSRQMGMRLVPYFLGNIVFTMILTVIVLGVLYFMTVLAMIKIITSANVLLFVLGFIVYAFFETGMALIFSSFKARPAVIKTLSSLYLIIAIIVAQILDGMLFINETWVYFYPHMMMRRIIWIALHGAPGQFYGSWICMLILFVEGIVANVIGLFLHVNSVKIFDTFIGTTKNKLGQIKDIMAANKSMFLSDTENMDTVDPDVISEEDRIKQSNAGDDMLQVLDIHKTYDGHPPKKALRGVTFGVQNGECFGLLGPNGAGKTTAISVMTALTTATHGMVLADGTEVDERSREHGVFGVCMQDDKLFDDLTIQETLLFYARIKGCPWQNQSAVAQTAAEIAGLDGDAYTQLAKTMSGGMKRRLSLACALIGRPKIIVLDEPTTGLDPGIYLNVPIYIQPLAKRYGKQSVSLRNHQGPQYY